jgi:hypothetical protein
VFIVTLIASRVLQEKKQRAASVVSSISEEYNIFRLIDSSLKNCKYFPIYPTINVKNNVNENIHFKVNHFLPNLKISAPSPKAIIKEVLFEENIIPNSEEYEEQYQTYLDRYNKGNFVKKEEGMMELSDSGYYELFLKAISDRKKLDALRKSNLKNYLKRKNGFHFNGEKFALDNFIYTRNQNEDEELYFQLRKTDYYTYRIMSDFSSDMIGKHGFDKKIAYGLLEYMGNYFQKNIHLGLSVSILVHCIRDNSLIITRRSAYTANPAGEAGLYFISANEGINTLDLNQAKKNELVSVHEIVQRALCEEIIGINKHDKPISQAIESCNLTGAFLYLPNMSISLCFCVSIDYDSKVVRNNYKFARDSGFEHSMIVNDRAWNSMTGLPEFTHKNIYDFLNYTVGDKAIHEVWDEGAVVTLALSTLVATS